MTHGLFVHAPEGFSYKKIENGCFSSCVHCVIFGIREALCSNHGVFILVLRRLSGANTLSLVLGLMSGEDEQAVVLGGYAWPPIASGAENEKSPDAFFPFRDFFSAMAHGSFLPLGILYSGGFRDRCGCERVLRMG